jgi:hypothetical protein
MSDSDYTRDLATEADLSAEDPSDVGPAGPDWRNRSPGRHWCGRSNRSDGCHGRTGADRRSGREGRSRLPNPGDGRRHRRGKLPRVPRAR